VFWPRVAKFLLWLGRWTAVGPTPATRKAVIIGAPHTSNWDGYWLLVYRVAYGVDVNFFVKKQMFWFPLSLLLTGMGAVPLDRRDSRSAVKQAVAAFNASDDYLFGLAPEGTRSKTKGWKSGFYRIAEEAGVPVVFGFFDYPNKRLGFGPMMMLTGDVEADMTIIRSFYESVGGQAPEKTGPVQMLRGKRRK
jgi:1-acyl-sn-glycerol-3-phosphate acyltransferase